MQFRTNVKYIAYISDCLIEICNTHTTTFGYQTHFFSQFTFKLHLEWIAFDYVLWVKGSGVMIENIGAGVAPVNIAFHSSRGLALIERKMFQNTKLSIKLHHCTSSEKKTKFLHCHTSLVVSQYIARTRNNTQTGIFYQNLLKIRCKLVLIWQMSTCTRTIQA